MKNRIVLCLLVIFAALIMTAAIAYAEEGSGEGENSDEGLFIAESSVPNGQTDVPIDAVIRFVFNKNVVNMTVAQNNSGCFSLMDPSGTNIPIIVEMGDDQIDPTIKRIISIRPVAALKAGTLYTIHISENLTAKNGTKLGTPIDMSFKTRSGGASGELINNGSVVSENENDGGQSGDLAVNSPEEDAGIVSSVDDHAQNTNDKTDMDGKPSSLLFLISTGCIAIALILFAVYLLRRKAAGR